MFNSEVNNIKQYKIDPTFEKKVWNGKIKTCFSVQENNRGVHPKDKIKLLTSEINN